MIIYKTTNLINNKIYIGQDSKNNPDYLGSGLKLLRAIKKYGKHNFTKEILEHCVDRIELDIKEIYWIKFLNATDRKKGYNITSGGNSAGLELGWKISKDGILNYWIEKYGIEIANIMWLDKKKKNSDYNKKYGTVFNTGIYEHWVEKYGKEEADKKLEIKKEKLRIANQQRAENGWQHTEESIEKIRNASKNRIVSDETRKKISENSKNIDWSKHVKHVLQFDKNMNLIKEWNSVKEIALFYNITTLTSIYRVLNGNRKTFHKFIWQYK